MWRCNNPFFRQVTLNEARKIAFIYNYGCNWACSICTYRIEDPCANGCKALSIEKIMGVIEDLAKQGRISEVRFLGGEPLINPSLGTIAKRSAELGLKVSLGHTNLSLMPPEEIESAVVSIKAMSEDVHIKYTGGFSNQDVLRNFIKCYEKGVSLKVNTVFVPEFVDRDEIIKIAEFIASVDERIPFHIIGYIPVPGLPWRRPTADEMQETAEIAKRFLKFVSWSLPSFPMKRSSRVIL